jgi:hypothetical protein
LVYPAGGRVRGSDAGAPEPPDLTVRACRV